MIWLFIYFYENRRKCSSDFPSTLENFKWIFSQNRRKFYSPEIGESCYQKAAGGCPPPPPTHTPSPARATTAYILVNLSLVDQSIMK